MNIMNFNKTSAFSLIELMVVIAIVALLAAIAVPSYKGYLNKAKASEVNALIQAQMAAVATAYSNGATTVPAITPSNGILGTGANATITGDPVNLRVMVGFGATGTAFDSVNFVTGALGLFYQGTDSNGVITWSCTTGTNRGYQTTFAGGTAVASGVSTTLQGLNYFSVNGASCS